MKYTTINVLGSTYTVEQLTKEADRLFRDRDGYCDYTSRRIAVKLPDETNELDNHDVYLKQITRHEIIHAFMFESGLGYNWQHPDFGHEETVVDWIAIQFPKIQKAFEEAGCL